MKFLHSVLNYQSSFQGLTLVVNIILQLKFIFYFAKNMYNYFSMPLVMMPDGGSPSSVTPARPSCDTRAWATLTRD
jgi:hypothetical protein